MTNDREKSKKMEGGGKRGRKRQYGKGEREGK